MLKFFKRPLGIILIIIVLAGIGIYFLFFRKSSTSVETVTATRGNIVQEVSVTGNTKPAETLDLAFEQAGKVRRVYADIGDNVSAGQILVELDSSQLYAELAEAEANIDVQKAELDELNKGATAEEIAVYEIKLSNARASIEDAKKNLIDKLQDAYTKSDDAVRNKVDQYFNNPRGSSPSLVFIATGSSEVERLRVIIEYVLNSWKASLDKLSISSDFDVYVSSANSNLDQIKSFLEKNASVLNSFAASASISQTSIDTYRSAVSTARTNVNAAIANLQDAEETFNSAKSDVLLAEKNLALEKAGSTPETIAAQAAQVKQTEASADVIRVKIGKNYLKSPISGIVTEQDAKVGEVISANTSIVSIISSGSFEIEASIPEADIAKVKIGDSARITLDAFGNDVFFDAKVTKINPGETLIEGVATYKTTFQFVNKNEGVKTGMTANIDITTAKKENVIVIPQKAVVNKDGGQFVRVLEEKAVKEYPAKTGLRGSDGNIEIIEGIKEGDRVITFVQGT